MSVKDNYPQIVPSLSLDFARTKVLDPRITFSRASTATFYDGKTVAKAEENLLQYSQEFDNAYWTKTNSTITANATTAPDGTSTAEKIVQANGTDGFIISPNFNYVSGQAYTVSCFAKKENYNYLLFAFPSAQFPASNRIGLFNLDTGTVATASQSGINATITNIGNGWYRCSITQTATSSSSGVGVVIAARPTDLLTGTGNGTDGIFIWGAQLEQRSTVTAYTPTTTQPITNYIPVLQTAAANVARFDHNPTTGESLGLRIEEQRTNIALYSEQFDNGWWFKNRSTVTSNAIIAPDGNLTADKVVETTATGGHGVLSESISASVSQTYTSSIYVKKAERTFAFISVEANNSFSFVGTQIAIFNIDAGTFNSTISAGTAPTLVGYSITNVGNGWFRISVTATLPSSGVNQVKTLAGPALNGTTQSYTGDGYSGVFIWGAQLEAGAFPTSYIATSASQVTRAADSASMTGTNFSSWYRADEGTMYAEFMRQSTNTLGQEWRIFALGGIDLAVFGTQTLFKAFGDSNVNISPGNYSANVYSKLVGTYKVNDFAASINGAAAVTDTVGILGDVTEAYIGNRPAGNRNINGYIRKLAYYPVRLSNTQLQALTQG